MSGMSPSSVLFSSDGYELDVSNNQSFTTERRALISAGISTGTNKHLFAATTNDGVWGSAPLTNKQPIQIAATVTASGSSDTSGLFNGAQEVTLVVNVGTVTGSGSIQYSIQQRDPGDGITLYGSTASTVVINNGNAPGVFTATLSITSASDVHIVWTVIGTFSATIYTTVITKTTPTTQTINGTIATTNSSVGTDGAAALGFDTQVGGVVTLNNPTYTAGNLRALSLTTEGGLRVFTDGYATTAAPTYTNNTSNPLSLTTSGDLRVVANQGTSPWITNVTNTVTVTGTVAVTQSTSPWVTSGTGNGFNNQSVGTDAATALGFDTQVGGIVSTAAPTYTNGNLDALSLTTTGLLRIDGAYAKGTTTANSADMMQVGGIVTTAAPTYTTGQINSLSLDTAGNLRTTAVTNKATVSSVTSVTVTANANNTLLAPAASRVFASVYNNTNKTLYIKCGTTASTASFTTQLFTGSYWEVPVDWTGELDAFAPSGSNGSILVTELTP